MRDGLDLGIISKAYSDGFFSPLQQEWLKLYIRKQVESTTPDKAVFTVKSRDVTKLRNDFLRQAARLLAVEYEANGCGVVSPSKKVDLLLMAISKYERAKHPHKKHLDQPPDAFDEVEQALFWAHKFCRERALPKYRHLLRICGD